MTQSSATEKETHGLLFDTLDFGPQARERAKAQGRGHWFEVAGADFDLGAPQPVLTTLASLLADGSLVEKTGDDNREQGFVVTVCGITADDIAAGEVQLARATGKPCEMVWHIPGGAATVFTVLTSKLGHSFNNRRMLRRKAQYVVSITALPFARSARKSRVAATPVAATPTTMDPGTSVARWSFFGSNDPVVVDVAQGAGRNAVRYSGSPAFSYGVQFNGPAPTQAFIALDTFAGVAEYLVLPDGTYGRPVATEPAPDAAYTRTWFARPDDVTTPLRFYVSNTTAQSGGVSSNPGTMYVGRLVQAAGIGAASLLAVPVEGSVRAPAAVTLSSATAMKRAMVFSDPAMAGGAYHPAIRGTWANAPAGTYSLWMSPVVGQSYVKVTVTDATGYPQVLYTRHATSDPVLMAVGEVVLGSGRNGKVGDFTIKVDIDNASGSEITVTTPTALRLFRRDRDTKLTALVVDRAAAGGAKKIVVEHPSIDKLQGGVWADEVAVVDDRLISWEPIVVAPSDTYLYVEGNDGVSTGITTLVEWFEHWHTTARTTRADLLAAGESA